MEQLIQLSALNGISGSTLLQNNMVMCTHTYNMLCVHIHIRTHQINLEIQNIQENFLTDLLLS